MTAFPLVVRLRQLAEALPEGAAVTLTREQLLALLEETRNAPESGAGEVFGDLTVVDIMAATNRARSTVCAWIASGELRAYRFGREWRVTRAAWQDFLDSRRDGKAAPGPAIDHTQSVDTTSWRKYRTSEQRRAA